MVRRSPVWRAWLYAAVQRGSAGPFPGVAWVVESALAGLLSEQGFASCLRNARDCGYSARQTAAKTAGMSP
jgi:hypothetical protein